MCIDRENIIIRLTLTACLCVLASCAPELSMPEFRTPPNVVLISMDTTRSDHCSVYGYSLNTTPNLQRIANEGARFDLAYSPTSATGPTHASLFTSLYPMEHGVLRNGLSLGDRFTTIAEHLRVNGYQTAAVVSSFVLDHKFGWGQGFDFYDDAFDRDSSKVQTDTWLEHKVEHGFDRRGNEVTRRALEWLDRDRDEERGFFLFLHYFDAHNPYEPPEPFLSRFAPQDESPRALDIQIGRYDGGIAFVDSQIGIFLDALEERRLSENTIVIVVGDHGEGLLQHGRMNHTINLYEELVRVPYLVRWPGHVQNGSTFASPVELLDVAPTLFDLLGIDVHTLSLRGRSLARALRGEEKYDAANRPVFLFRRHYAKGRFPGIEGRLYAMRAGDWKYINGSKEKRRLFNLAEDPFELSNVFDSHRDVAAHLQEKLDAWREANTIEAVTQTVISDEDREALEALGYVD